VDSTYTSQSRNLNVGQSFKILNKSVEQLDADERQNTQKGRKRKTNYMNQKNKLTLKPPN